MKKLKSNPKHKIKISSNTVGVGLCTTQKKQNGITLIALVITIIVLLILSGIIILGVLGPNGIIEKATQAKIQSKNAKYSEDVMRIVYEEQITLILHQQKQIIGYFYIGTGDLGHLPKH